MKAPDTIMIEGRAYSWRAILELRRNQIAAEMNRGTPAASGCGPSG